MFSPVPASFEHWVAGMGNKQIINQGFVLLLIIEWIDNGSDLYCQKLFLCSIQKGEVKLIAFLIDKDTQRFVISL